MAEQETESGKAVDAHGEPVVDPTANVRELVIAAMQRQDDLRKADAKLFQSGLQALRDFIEARLGGMDAALAEKFGGIANQFAERDKRTEQLSLADKTAIAAALQAQKENAASTYEALIAANAKTEAGFTKQIDAIVALNTTANKGLEDKITAIGSRIDRGEGSQVGVAAHSSAQRSEVGMYVGIIGLAAAVIIPLIMLLMRGN